MWNRLRNAGIRPTEGPRIAFDSKQHQNKAEQGDQEKTRSADLSDELQRVPFLCALHSGLLVPFALGVHVGVNRCDRVYLV